LNLKTLLKISYSSLKKHKGRSLLTILGIIIGIASIISTLAIGYGAEEKQRKEILGMGYNFIFIQPGKYTEGKTQFAKRKTAHPLQEKHVELIKHQCFGIKKLTPTFFLRNIISFKSNNVSVDTKCGNQDYLDVIGRKIERGIFFTKYHVLKNSKVIVLGSKTAKELFGTLNPIGNTVKINNVFFNVVGVVAPMENYVGFADPNLDVYIPFTTARKQLMHKNDPYIHGIAISAKRKQEMPYIVKRLTQILRFLHRLQQEEPDDFTILDQQAMVKAAKKSSGILNLLLLIIASISLLVGGIGIMNIMLVTVTERTQEIGIRMAVGASNATILKQFILESITLCLIGGVIGVLLGVVAPYAVCMFTKWPVVIKPSTIIFAFLTTFFIGLIFGFYPARKASKLNPVDALQEN
jgi:putative ABC transport system permease protein